MKRILFIFLAAVMSTTICSAAMSNSKIRKETLFLTDKMAYEMGLNTEQYNDVYEINYDFISDVSYLMDDILRGEEWALNRYYDNLDVRNDDLRWVLSSRQYGRFMQADYFYRPLYINSGRWSFRVYINYTNHNHFYYPRPYHYRTYCGGHHRTRHNHASYYRGRYNHSVYSGSYRLRDNRTYTTTRRSDFGTVNIRPNSSTRPAGSSSTRRSSSGNNRESVKSSSRSSSGSSSSSSSTRRSDTPSSSRKTNAESTKTKDNNSSSRGSSRVSSEGSSRRSSSTSTRSSSDKTTKSSRSSEDKPRR